MHEPESQTARNVLGSSLKPCSTEPMTGFFRDGCCNTSDADVGAHTVCVEMTDDFLAFSKDAGNDLSTPRPEFDFPGLQAGDRWCLCAMRWVEALQEDRAPRVVLESTHERTLEFIDLATLRGHAIPG
ncbi:MAG: DUF2237 domain-containing protein [Planctomycetes bacterium]|nr:DUF2237 domain-containing protein [Planctomycetota bacterium]